MSEGIFHDRTKITSISNELADAIQVKGPYGSTPVLMLGLAFSILLLLFLPSFSLSSSYFQTIATLSSNSSVPQSNVVATVSTLLC